MLAITAEMSCHVSTFDKSICQDRLWKEQRHF